MTEAHIRRNILLWLMQKIAWRLYGKYNCDSFEFIRADNGKEFVITWRGGKLIND